ncbi:hypothetical protein ACFX1Z_006280 [Malus domestica]
MGKLRVAAHRKTDAKPVGFMSKKFLFWVCSLSKYLIGFCIFESWFMSFSFLIILIVQKPWETSVFGYGFLTLAI